MEITNRMEATHAGCSHIGCTNAETKKLETTHDGCSHSGCTESQVIQRLE